MTNQELGEAGTPFVPQRALGLVDQSYYLIGVGASAGGLDAIKQLIAQLPADFPHSFVIVQHISPDYKSLMSEILGRETKLAVKEITDNMEVHPGHIYLIPPKANIVIQGTPQDNSPAKDASADDNGFSGLRFSLVNPSPRPKLNLPTDIFFQSLAEAVGDRSIAIILSGTGSDGSRGLRAVKDRDGFVLVQDPMTASFDGMPRAALATKLVDVVAPPDAMFSEIKRYFEMRESGIINAEQLFKDEKQFSELLSLVSRIAEIDFSQYKEPTLKRRIARRMMLCNCVSAEKYLAYVKDNPGELSVLHREFLVGVTNFFRDLPMWRHLEEAVIPVLFDGQAEDPPIKIWSVGCSTGEEAYTIALLLEAYRRKNHLERDFRVYATDVNENAIQSAKDGIYSSSVFEEIPEAFRTSDLINYQAGTLHISREIRKKMIFSVHNIIEDPPYVNTDLLICRNMLIYLSPEMQKKVIALFSFSLRKDGFLFLGVAETVPRDKMGFQPLSSAARIYKNTNKTKLGLLRSNLNVQMPQSAFLPRAGRPHTSSIKRNLASINLLVDPLLSRTKSCIFVLDEVGQIIESFGDYKRYIDIPDRSFSSNLIELVPDRLKSALSLSLREAAKSGNAEKLGVRFATKAGEKLILNVHAQKFEWDTHAIAFSVIVNEANEPPTTKHDLRQHEAPEDENQTKYIGQLEDEIESLQEMLSATTEDLSVANEELQSANEELIASNEELQANNEEMQSTNEELHTVNAENMEKIIELEHAYADIENLLDNADLATLFLDTELRIRRFSRGLACYFELNVNDVGRYLSNFSPNLPAKAMTTLLDDAGRAVESDEYTRREFRCQDGHWVFCRVKPFRTLSGEIDGVVITFTDITEIKRLEEEVRTQRDRLEGLLESEGAGYWDWNIPEKTKFMSARFKQMFGYDEHEIANTVASWQAIIHPDDLPKVLSSFDAHLKSQGSIPYDNEVRYYHRDGSIVWVICRGRVIEWAEDGSPARVMGVHIDITPQKLREEKVQKQAEELQRFAFIAAHDLLQPANTITSSLDIIREDLEESLSEDNKALMGFVTAASVRLKARVNGILEYARLQDQALEFTRLSLAKIASGCVDDLRALIEEAGAKVSIGRLPKALGAPGLVARVFQNLLSNAIKYRDPERGCEIIIERAPAPAGFIGVRVTDNGIGIPEAHRTKVFELFARLHPDSDYEGSGVGLALCERIVARHDGRIWVEDNPSGGSSFVFILKKPG